MMMLLFERILMTNMDCYYYFVQRQEKRNTKKKLSNWIE